MGFPWSNKKPAQAEAAHWQPPAHGPMTSRYGREENGNPKRLVSPAGLALRNQEAGMAQVDERRSHQRDIPSGGGWEHQSSKINAQAENEANIQAAQERGRPRTAVERRR